MFYCREQELQKLNRRYADQHFECVVIYGRRRVGKTALIKEFCKDKPVIFFSALNATSQENLESLSAAIFAYQHPDLAGNDAPVYPSFDAALQEITRLAETQRIIFVIDEYPHLAKAYKSFSSRLQHIIDHTWQNSQLFLILCGSSVSFMEKEVLSEKSPLYGRRTAQFRIEPFKYWDAAKFTPNYTYEEKAICYGVTGGIPYYLSLIDDSMSLMDNLYSLFFTKNGYLFGEVNYLLEEEFSDVANYSAIIDAIARGSSKPNEIADKSHIEVTAVSHKLNTLVETGIVEKRSAVTDEKNRKKVMYVLKDGMFRFWYKFVPNGFALIELGKSRPYFDKVVQPKISEYMGDIFEDMCRDYTLLVGAEGMLKCFVTKTGKWWGTNPVLKETTDIDVVGLDQMDKTAVIGECKFKNEACGKAEYDALIGRTNLIHNEYSVVQYLIFSKSGFSDWLLQNKPDNTKLVSLEEMYQITG